MINTLKTPVAFIIFNRPDYAKKVFNKIREARPEKLFVIADGARDKEEWEKCNEARNIINQVDWNCEVYKNYSDKNLGCRKRISSGIDWFFDNADEGIILEDDCIPHASFFIFCEEMLKKYRYDERIMMITGDNPVKNIEIKDSYLFSRYFPIWGWATWKRAWSRYDASLEDWPELKSQKLLENFYTHKGIKKFLINLFDKEYNKTSDSWGVHWFYSCLFNNGLCIVPRVNLVSNIGVKGVHSSPGRNNNVPTEALDVKDIKHPKFVFPDYIYDNTFFNSSFPVEIVSPIKVMILKFLVKVKRLFKKSRINL